MLDLHKHNNNQGYCVPIAKKPWLVDFHNYLIVRSCVQSIISIIGMLAAL
jgi:hypothetical protein